jgi:glutaminyl-peptide cyclotransferase
MDGLVKEGQLVGRAVRVLSVLSAVFIVSTGIAGCGQSAPPLPAFNGQRSYDMLEAQCDFGPRPPGTDAHEKTRQYLVGELKRCGLAVKEQTFTASYLDVDYSFTNIIAEYRSRRSDASDKTILLCAHWDTREQAEQELDEENRTKPILGANDGASGVAVLLEIARLIKESPPKSSVTIVLFDGEDLGESTLGGMFFGSKHYASTLKKPYPTYGILLDMIGDAQLRVPKEYYSHRRAPQVVAKVWDAAAAAGHGSIFVDDVGTPIIDDHIQLLDAGIPCIDVIDFNYAYWHTLKDTPDKCSAESLQAVGDTVVRVIWTEEHTSRQTQD